ncbi:MAG: alpha/beta hydrolase [Coraliomargarita sp.]
MLQTSLIYLLIAIGIVYLGLNGYAAIFAHKQIFPHVEPSYTKDSSIIELDSEDGEQIAAYYLKATPLQGKKRLLIYCHGNGEDIGHCREWLGHFQKLGISALAYDYPGYGISSGKATEDGCNAATKAAYRYATKELGYAPGEIILYGRSLGGGPACWLAEQHTVGCLILDGTFTSTFRVVTKRKLLPWDHFDNYARLPHIETPILVVHGTKDLTVPFSHARRNYEVIQSPKAKLWVEGAGHSDLISTAGEVYWETLLGFIDTHIQPQSKPQ